MDVITKLNKFINLKDHSVKGIVSFQTSKHEDVVIIAAINNADESPIFKIFSRNDGDHDFSNNNPNYSSAEEQLTKILSPLGILNAITLYIDNRGDVILLCSFDITQDGLDESVIYQVRSSSYGKSWNPSEKISLEFTSWKLIGQPILLKRGNFTGQITIPIFDTMTKRPLILVSHDNGKNWAFSLNIELDIHSDDEGVSPIHAMTSQVFEQEDGLLRLICNVEGDENTLFTAHSTDYAHTWSHLVPFSIDALNLSSTFTLIKDIPEKNLFFSLASTTEEKKEEKYNKEEEMNEKEGNEEEVEKSVYFVGTKMDGVKYILSTWKSDDNGGIWNLHHESWGESKIPFSHIFANISFTQHIQIYAISDENLIYTQINL